MKKRTLVIGAVPDAERYSHKACMMLQEYGHEVTAVGIKLGTIGSVQIQAKWPEGQEFDTVSLYINPTIQANYVDQILQMKPLRVVFNPGSENAPFEEKLKAAGIFALEACTLVLLRTNQY